MITIVKLGARKQRRDNGKYSFVNRTIKLWNEVTAEALATFTCKSLIFIRRVRKWGEVKGFWNVVTKPPKVQGCEKWRVKCSEVKWNEVMILGEMCVLSLIYIYVAVCRFCAVHCLIIICFCLLFSNYSLTFFLGMFSFSCILCFLLFCVLFLLLHTAASFLFLYKFTDHCHRLETHMQKIHKYHIISYHIVPYRISHRIIYHIVSYHIIYHIIPYRIIYRIISYIISCVINYFISCVINYCWLTHRHQFFRIWVSAPVCITDSPQIIFFFNAACSVE